MKTIFFITVVCIFLNIESFAQNVNWVSSTELHHWVKESPVKLKMFVPEIQVDTEILSEQKCQTIDGWGGCFNELGWDALQLLDNDERNMVMESLFSQDDGLKFSICRMPIGANDYARNWYSLNDSTDDFSMKNFGIARDQRILIPYIHEAMKYQPKLKVWASPWSPPIWMKTNHHYANKPGDHNDLKPENTVLSGDQFIQEQKYLSAYSLYLSKFVKSYQKEGINVYAIHFQNEPYTLNQWPNCSWTPPAMRDFIAKYLGPAFEKNEVNAQIWLGTWNTDKIANFDTVFSSPEVMKYIAGAGLQWEGKNIISELHLKYPKVKLIQTESECGNGDFAWKDAEHTFGLIKKYIEGGASAYMYWNMVLADKGTSTWGWNQNALIQIDSQSKKVTYTPEYWMFKHYCFFATTGSVLIKNNGNESNMVAFINPSNELIVVAANFKDSSKKMNIKIGESYFTAELQARSFNTFIIKL